MKTSPSRSRYEVEVSAAGAASHERHPLPLSLGTALRLTLLAGTVLGATGVGLALATGISAQPVLSASMAPSLHVGDLVLVRSVPTSSLRVGDIPLIVPTGQVIAVAHRITALTPGTGGPRLTTRGDANPAADAVRPTVLEPTTARVIAVVPRVGQLAGLLTRLPVQPTLLVVLGIALIGLALRTAGLHLAMAGTVLAGGLSLTGLGVHASLTGAADLSLGGNAQPVGSGTLHLRLSAAGAGLRTPIAALTPGDSLTRYLVLDNVGTLAGAGLALHVDSVGASRLTTDATRGLQATLTTCTVAWTPGTGGCSGVVGRPVTAAVATLIAGPVLVSGGRAPATVYLQLRVALPQATEESVNGVLPPGSVQGLSSGLTWNFTQTQYTGAAPAGAAHEVPPVRSSR